LALVFFALRPLFLMLLRNPYLTSPKLPNPLN
jgi:hypothetical protein